MNQSRNMNKKIKITQIPNRAKDLYIQIYCDKRGGKTKECVYNATKSWLSLSLTKKRHFYNTVTTKSVVKNAQRIIKTKPFLKAKESHTVRKRKTVQKSNDDQQNEEPGPESSTADHDLPIHDEMECDHRFSLLVHNENSICGSQPGSSNLGPVSTSLQESEAECCSEGTQNEPQMSEAPENTSHMSVIDEDTNTSIENNNNEQQTEHPMLIEPLVPIIKNGKELYELLSSRKGTSNVPYESLTAKEKRFYGNAVSRIKREFVTHYKAYLESLTPRQLFDYYLKTF